MLVISYILFYERLQLLIIRGGININSIGLLLIIVTYVICRFGGSNLSVLIDLLLYTRSLILVTFILHASIVSFSQLLSVLLGVTLSNLLVMVVIFHEDLHRL